MLVYHGTENSFTVFDYSRIGQHGSSEGKGFYFTDSKQIALSYANNGYVLTVKFRGNKLLHYTDKVITIPEWKRYLRKLHKVTDCLNNYDDVHRYGVERVLSKAIETEYKYSTNDVDMVCSICNGCGDTENGLKMLYEVLGYDSVQVEADWGRQRLYIALTNDIIEIVNVESADKARREAA